MARREEEQFIVRLPPGWRDRIKTAAAENRRSMNAELLFHLGRVYGEPAAEPKAGTHSPAADH